MSSLGLRVACLQMNSVDSVQENLDFISASLDSNPQKLDLLVLPENFAQMPATEHSRYTESMGSGTVQSFLREMAIRHQINIVAGSLPVRGEDPKPYSRSMILSPEGFIGGYDKIHLFDVDLSATGGSQAESYRESDHFLHGDITADNIRVKTLKTAQNEVRIGLSICYDLRFPELFRKFAEQDAHLVCVPSAFTYQTGKSHWQTLLRARAIENQCFIIASAQAGVHANGRETWGHSMIIDCWGSIVAEKKAGLGLLYATLDLSQIAQVRRQIPVLDHRRLS